MKTKELLRLSILLLVLGIILMSISARGCPKRSRDKIRSSGYEWAGIAAPSSLTATAFSYSEIRLSWQDNSDNEDGFQIERSTDNLSYALLSTLNANTTSYSDIGLASFTTYYYRIRAYNTMGDYSGYSNIASVSLQPIGWLALAGGDSHSLALATDRMLWGWGDNQYGQLDPTSYEFTITRPAILNTATDWSNIAAGYWFTLSIKTNNTLWSWGANESGQLGLGTTDYTNEPNAVGTDSDWIFAVAGANHSIALKSNGTIWSCGANRYQQGDRFFPGGQLGLGDSMDRNTFTQIGSDTDWFIIAAGNTHSLAIKTNDTLWVWGLNGLGQLGDGTSTTRTTPRQIGMDSDWSMVTASYVNSAALKTTGTLWKWGESTDSPQQVGSDIDWLSISAGGSDVASVFQLVLKTDGRLWSWGKNIYGQLGLGDTNNRIAPVQIPAPPDTWTLFAAGGYHALACDVAGNLWTWGRNNFYQLGLGNTNNASVPLPINLNNLPRPTNLVATVITRTEVALSWTENSDNESGFVIERSISPTTGYSLLATVNPNVTSFSDSTVTQGNTYYYRLKAVYPTGESSYSNVAAVVTRIWDFKIGSPPPVRSNHSMIWDGTRMIMFGGYGNSPTYKNDLWWYDPGTNSWIEQGQVSQPSQRSGHAMVWDGSSTGGSASGGQKIIMFGGQINWVGGRMNDVWWYDPDTNTWTEKITRNAPGSPSARSRHSMVWDPIRNVMIMFGGTEFDGTRNNDLWWYDPTSNTWTEQIPTAISPTARSGHSMVWDGQKVIMFGGNDGSYCNDLWWYDPTSNTWLDQTPTTISPTARNSHSMVWDGQKVIMFGGNDGSYCNDLWWYESNIWTEKPPVIPDTPSARYGHSMVWDTSSINGQKMIMFGGRDASSYKNDLWWYDPSSGTNGAWIQKTPTGGPPLVRYWHSMVWDTSSINGQKVIMFGGYTGSAYKNDLWWYDPSSGTNGAWIQKTPTGGPPSARYGHSMVWDTSGINGQKMIMFGGRDASSYKNDLWWYDPVTNTWTEQTPVSTPSARYGHSMVWDGQNVILFGGYTGSDYKNDLWWYDPALNTWTEKTPPRSPSARYYHSMVWDGQKVILFGGEAGSSNNDLWWYYPGTNTWTKHISVTNWPPARWGHSMVWDNVGQRMIMFGGYAGTTYKNDLWWWW